MFAIHIQQGAGSLSCLTDLLSHFLCRFVMPVLAHWEAVLLWEEEEVRQEEEGRCSQATASKV